MDATCSPLRGHRANTDRDKTTDENTHPFGIAGAALRGRRRDRAAALAHGRRSSNECYRTPNTPAFCAHLGRVLFRGRFDVSLWPLRRQRSPTQDQWMHCRGEVSNLASRCLAPRYGRGEALRLPIVAALGSPLPAKKASADCSSHIRLGQP
jgi:hypothetical protein